MRLRPILLVLSFLAFVSASIGGFLYYTSLRQAAYQSARRQVVQQAALIRKSLAAFLSENTKTVATLAGMQDLAKALSGSNHRFIDQANAILDHFQATLGVDVCYLMDRRGITIASSNRRAKDSFVGKDFSFRPYFKKAISGQPASYLALGTTSGRRGVYHSYPVYDPRTKVVLGVAVIKSSIEETEKRLGLPPDDVVLVTDPRGVVFISNRPQWLFHHVWPLSKSEKDLIGRERQFGKGPWRWIGFEKIDSYHARNRDGEVFFMHQEPVDMFTGWKIIHLSSRKAIGKALSAPLLRAAGPLIAVLCILIGVSVLILYRKASREIVRRRTAEQALRQSEARYRFLYHHTPAMLHSIDLEGKLVSVSDYWIETMGYSRRDVIGRPLTDFMSPESRQYAEARVMPEFFRNGFCKDVPYRFVKKDGRVMDVLLSAIADRDDQGNIQRTLAVSIDVTERKRAEEALRRAQAKLKRYSQDLEQQVRKRTSEIAAILKYTPAVIYMKDQHGHFVLVNSRYEELFGVSQEKVRGKDPDLLELPSSAVKLHRYDDAVLENGEIYELEDNIRVDGSEHTYLTVKFPIYGDDRELLGVCGIATDISAEKRAQAQLRRLSAAIMDSQEKERAAIARELHDELGQVLTALRMDAVWLSKRLHNKEPDSALRARQMCSLIDRTIEEVKGMAVRLRPGVLDHLGLVDALEWYTAEFERRAQIPCLFEHKGISRLDGTIATAVYRIAQEALTNVARHAGATKVEVKLAWQKERLVLSVSDDGKGFNPDRLDDNQGLGLAGMRERASLVSGKLEVDSAPGRGTCIVLKVPIA